MSLFDKIKVICLDVDGTLTDGQIYISNDGIESKAFSVKDGLAIAQVIKKSYLVVLITGRKSKVVEIRAGELGIKEIHQGIHNKVEKLSEILEKYDYDYDNVLYIGDDINDLCMAEKVGLFACPNDACTDVLEKANIISTKNGGHGAVREILENFLREKSEWDIIVKNYEGGIQ